MIRELKRPPSLNLLEGIVALQKKIFTFVCDTDMTPEKVTEEAFKRILKDYPAKWVESFCTKKYKPDKNDEGLKIQDRLKSIAGLSEQQKINLLSAFQNDLNFHEAFEPYLNANFQFAYMQLSKDAQLHKLIKDFFALFYKSRFYYASNNRQSGYYIPKPDKIGEFDRIHRTDFVEDFRKTNTERVCCYCEGPLDDSDHIEVDHFYPISQLPFLSCHPLNLFPVCKKCNDTKKANLPFYSENVTNVFSDWPHPYLNSLHKRFDIIFIRDGARLRPKLDGHDSLTCKQLNNAMPLIELEDRWQTKFQTFEDDLQTIMTSHLRRQQRKGKLQNRTKNMLIDKLETICEEEADLIGKRAYHSMWIAYLGQLWREKLPIRLDEILEHVCDELPNLPKI